MSEEILAGRNSVTEALRSGRSINKLFVQDGIKGGSVSEILGLAKTAGVVLEFCKSERLDKLAGGLRHQGFVALAAPIRFHSLEEVWRWQRKRVKLLFYCYWMSCRTLRM